MTSLSALPGRRPGRGLFAGHPARAAARHALLILACVVSVYPLLWMVFGSLKSNGNFYSGIWGPPSHPLWSNFSGAWSEGGLGGYLLNSVIVTASTVVLVCVLGYLLAYAVARMKMRGGNVILGIFAVSLFVPVQLLLIPLFVLESDIHLFNSYWSLVLPYAAGALPFTVIFLSAYLRSIPREIDEAAVIDGCKNLRLLWHVMVPLSRPAFATVVIFTFLNSWNEFLLALTLIQTDARRTLPVGLLNFSQSFGMTNYPYMFAALTISAVPIIAVFVAFQKKFIGGLTAGAVKM
jgi:raffinose/stachyose/melibiose transport system permease protein